MFTHFLPSHGVGILSLLALLCGSRVGWADEACPSYASSSQVQQAIQYRRFFARHLIDPATKRPRIAGPLI